MSSFSSKFKASLGALAVLGFATAGAQADEPSPAAIGYANQIFVYIGMKPSLDQVVPAMLGQLEHNVTSTRPELKDSLHAALLQIEPEFVKSEQGVLADAAKYLATHMSEQELKETVAFYESPAGKKFLSVEPGMVQEIAASARTWREKLSTDILARAHEEMKKKGTDF